jgi:hypothetical protein
MYCSDYNSARVLHIDQEMCSLVVVTPRVKKH